MTSAAPRPAPAGGQPAARGVSAARSLVCRLGSQVVVLAAGTSGRVVEIESCTRVPTGPDYLIGVGNGQGTLLVVVDIRPLLGLPASPWSWPIRAQIVGDDRMRVAFAIEEVLGLADFGARPIDPLAAQLPAALRAYGLGMLATREGSAVVLDVPRIVEALRVERK